MGSRKPGPLCVTIADAIDKGTNCRHRSQPPGVIGLNVGTEKVRNPVKFSDLWAGYPSSKPYVNSKTGEVPSGYENQCAIKVSVALVAAGEKLTSFKGAVVTVNREKAAVRAQELVTWLKKERIPGRPLMPESIAGADWQSKIKKRTGIVYFADYWLRPGEKTPSGDHIDLRNGSRLTASGFEGALTTIARFGLGMDSGPGFSDLGKSKTILFWEVR